MASARQLVAILGSVLNIGETGRFHAEALRHADLIPSTPGKATPLTAEQVALLLISVLIDNPLAAGHSELVVQYASMRMGAGGPTLGSILAGHFDKPHDLFELRLELDAPGASISFRGSDRGMATIVFSPDRSYPTPAFDRTVAVDGNTFTRLAAAIRNAPEIKAGRRRRSKRHNTEVHI
jgi:hypothetical protein